MSTGDKVFLSIFFGIVPMIAGLGAIHGEDTLVIGVIFIMLSTIVLTSIWIYPHIKEIHRLRDAENNLELEQHIKDMENNLKHEVIKIIDDTLLFVSIFSGIPVSKINKEKAISSVMDYITTSALTHHSTDSISIEDKLIKIIWDIAKEGNQFKEKKLQDYSPNSKIKIKFKQIICDASSKISENLNISVSGDTIKKASSLIIQYIDKFVYHYPNLEQEQDMLLPIISFALFEKENETKILNKLGNDFYKALIITALKFLTIYTTMLETNEITPSSEEYINSLNTFNYYIEILEENK